MEVIFAVMEKQKEKRTNDLISRQAAIEAIKRAIWDKYTAKDAIDAVCNVPSAQERKKGQWHKCDNGCIAWYECSVCGCEPLRSKWNGEYVYSDFCPTCGADMRAGEGERDETD